MPGALIRIDTEIKDERVLSLLKRLSSHIDNMTPVMRSVGETVLASIRRNFKEGGRPVRWKKSKRVIASGGVTLTDNAILKNSINVAAGKDWTSIGTSDKRAGLLNFGAKKGEFGTVQARVKEHIRKISQAFGKPIEPKDVKVKAHTRTQILPWGDIPAREFMMVQEEDWDEINDLLWEHLSKI